MHAGKLLLALNQQFVEDLEKLNNVRARGNEGHNKCSRKNVE